MCELEVYQPVNGKLTCAQFEANFAALAELVARYQIVEELPETIEPCRQVLYNGTMWRGLLEGESSLPAGTPWPVKGYKELKLSVELSVFGYQSIERINDGFIISYNFDPIQYNALEVIFDPSTPIPFNDTETFANPSTDGDYFALSPVNNVIVSDTLAIIVDTNGTGSIFFATYKLYPPQ